MTNPNDELLWSQALEVGDTAYADRLAAKRRDSAPILSDTAITLIRITDDGSTERSPRAVEAPVSKYGDPSTENPE